MHLIGVGLFLALFALAFGERAAIFVIRTGFVGAGLCFAYIMWRIVMGTI